MDRSGQIETDRSVLMRIAALLLALADLAERAAGASRPVRYQVLWALRQADEVVSEFVTGSACEGGPLPPASTPVRHSFDRADAENLAASLRMLAFMVQAMAARTSRSFSHCGIKFRFAEGELQGPVDLSRNPNAARGEGKAARAPPRPPARAPSPIFSKDQWPGPIMRRGVDEVCPLSAL
jgi:hypothetical protein